MSQTTPKLLFHIPNPVRERLVKTVSIALLIMISLIRDYSFCLDDLDKLKA